MTKTAILVDGGFYRKRAPHLWGKKPAAARAKELQSYCSKHLMDKDGAEAKATISNLLLWLRTRRKKECLSSAHCTKCGYRQVKYLSVDDSVLGWAEASRKFALRLGELSSHSSYNLTPQATKDLFLRKRTLDEITEKDFVFVSQQKGVDMRIGVDIASMAYKKQVNQIILIAGDSDFVPAAKLARREGIDFILDPMWANIQEDLFEHIDGLKSYWKPAP